MRSVPAKEVRRILKKQWPMLEHIWLFDRWFLLPGYLDAQRLLKNLQDFTQGFQYELFDCDDFSLVTNAFVKLKIASEPSVYKYNWAFGEIMGEQPTIGVHIQNLFITDEERVLYWEPQLRQIEKPDNDSAFFVRM